MLCVVVPLITPFNIPKLRVLHLTTQKSKVDILKKFFRTHAGVAELADARDSKSRGIHFSCGFDPHLQYHRVFIDLV